MIEDCCRDNIKLKALNIIWKIVLLFLAIKYMISIYINCTIYIYIYILIFILYIYIITIIYENWYKSYKKFQLDLTVNFWKEESSESLYDIDIIDIYTQKWHECSRNMNTSNLEQPFFSLLSSLFNSCGCNVSSFSMKKVSLSISFCFVIV